MPIVKLTIHPEAEENFNKEALSILALCKESKYAQFKQPSKSSFPEPYISPFAENFLKSRILLPPNMGCKFPAMPYLVVALRRVRDTRRERGNSRRLLARFSEIGGKKRLFWQKFAKVILISANTQL